MSDAQMRTWAEIDLGRLKHNYTALREQLAPGCRFVGVVKANAYGHGAVPVAQKLEEWGADYLAVAFDLKAPTFRHKMFDAYKGTRKPMPEELHEQVPLMKEVLTAMGVPILTKEGYEADDILGTIAKREQKDGYEVTILSGDRDLLQLSDTHIRICLPKTSRGTTEVHNYYPEDVIREYQVTPEQFIEVKALISSADPCYRNSP